MKCLAVKNFEKFQHYRDRAPVWIKLYAALLEDWDFLTLPEAAQAQLVKLWLLASRMDNRVPNSRSFIAAKLQTKRLYLKEIIAAGFVTEVDANDPREIGPPLRADWASRHVPADVRDRVLARTNGCCGACGSPENVEVDHIVPVSQGGTGDESNLQALCRKCNRKKRTRTATAAQLAAQEQHETPGAAFDTTDAMLGPVDDVGHVRHFLEPRHRAGYLGVRRASQSPLSLDFEVQLIAEGGERPGQGKQQALGWAIVGEALHQLSMGGGRVTPRGLLAFCEELWNGKPGGGRTPSDTAGRGRGQERARLWLAVAKEFDLLAFSGNREQYDANRARARASGQLGDTFDAEWECVRLWDRIGTLPEHVAVLEIAARLAGQAGKAV